MAILKPDKTTTLGGVTVNEYLLTKHNPNNIDMPSVSMEGKIIGITVHNTDWITTAAGTTSAEQYTRATVNGNMKDVRVHYYVDNVCAWRQCLRKKWREKNCIRQRWRWLVLCFGNALSLRMNTVKLIQFLPKNTLQVRVHYLPTLT